MPRFYFHVHDGEVCRDEEGKDLADGREARRCAIEGARGLMCGQLHDGFLRLDHWIEVTDDSGNQVLIVRFADAIELGSG